MILNLKITRFLEKGNGEGLIIGRNCFHEDSTPTIATGSKVGAHIAEGRVNRPLSYLAPAVETQGYIPIRINAIHVGTGINEQLY
ncbi:hypothetical protein HG530_001619 [Fusarium avenaceum]|nr:hypothetical protein HG530_001619 [Fusarium avenaceum]